MDMICAHCGKVVYKNAKIDTYRRKLGNKALNKVDYYHDKCFSLLQQERARNEHWKKERISKGKNSR